MASNSYNNAVLVARKAMAHLENNIVLPGLCNRQYDKMFSDHGAVGKGGATAYARIPGRYTSTTGAAADPNGYNDTTAPIAVTQFQTSCKFTTAELALNLDDPDNNLIPSLMESLASEIDVYLAGKLDGIYQTSGAPGTAITSHAPFLTANAILDEALAPKGKRFALLAPRVQGAVLGAASTLFNPQEGLAEQYISGKLGRAFGLDWYMNQNLGSHKVGPLGGTPVAGTAVEGASTLPTTGWTAAAASRLKKGDVFTVANVYKVNPVTGLSSGQLQQFQVTADFSSLSDGTGSIAISPAMITTGPTATIDALPASGAALTIVGTANSTSANSFVLHPDALVMVGVPCAPGGPRSHQVYNPRLKLSIRVAEFWDGQADTHLTRFDVIAGAVLARPTLGCRVW